MSIRGTEKFEKGRRGEQLVMKLLKDAGWYVIPSYDYCGQDEKPPRMQGRRGFFVIPDLDASRDGVRDWFEVKTKASATYTRKLDQWDHGIPRRHFDDYLRVQRESGCRVWLVIYEENTGAILVREIDALRKCARHYTREKMSRGGMVFFPRSAFRLYPRRARQEDGDAA